MKKKLTKKRLYLYSNSRTKEYTVSGPGVNNPDMKDNSDAKPNKNLETKGGLKQAFAHFGIKKIEKIKEELRKIEERLGISKNEVKK